MWVLAGPIVDTKSSPKPVLIHGLLDSWTNVEKILHIDGLAQDCGCSSALAMELLEFAVRHRYKVN